MYPNALTRDERGIALPTAIFALVVIGALVAGIFFTARIEVRSGENTMSEARATEAAQAGLMMGYPNVVTLAGALANGAQAGVAKTQIGTTGSYYADTVTKLNNYMFLLRSMGSYEVNGTVIAQRTLAMLIKRYVPELNLNAGAIVVGSATVTGSVKISGNDSIPPGWTGCTDGPDQAGLRVSGNANGNKLSSGTVGTPQYVDHDTTVTNMSRIMDTLFFQLAAQANKTITGGTASAAPTYNADGTCKTSDITNWGDYLRTNSNHACETYFPIVYLNPGGPGNTVVVHADGQGILLVNGDLKFNSTNHFDGLIIVRGTYIHGSGTADIMGSVISQNVDLSNADFSGNLNLTYSSCSVQDAIKNVAVSAPSTYRGFIQY